jgi:hypothetical protein
LDWQQPRAEAQAPSSDRIIVQEADAPSTVSNTPASAAKAIPERMVTRRATRIG